jgi:hypothetical protein
MDVLPYASGLVDSARDNGSAGTVWGSVKSALTWAAAPILTPVSVTNNIGAGLATGAAKAGEGVKAVGTSIGNAVNSVTGGIKWAVAILILLVVGFYLLPIIPSLIASRRTA